MYSTPRVTQFAIVGSHQLAVSFSDGSEQQVDFRPALIGDRFAPLQDLEKFNAVAIDPFGALVWPNGATIDPFTLHDWNRGDGKEFVAKIEKAIKSERRQVAWNKWSVGITLALFAYQLIAWLGFIDPAHKFSLGSLLLYGAMVLIGLADWLMQRSAALAWSVMLCAFVVFGFAIVHLHGHQ